MHLSPSRTTLLRAAVLLLAGLATLAGVGSGPAAAAGDDLPWTVSTASNDYGSDRPDFGYTVNPGGTVEDGVVIVNRGPAPLVLGVDSANGLTTKTGSIELVTKDAKSSGLRTWVRLSRDSVTVEPGRSVEVPFTVNVPDDASPGDHVGGIVTSLTSADGATVGRRLAIQIRLRVGGRLKPMLSIEDLDVDYSGAPNPFAKGDATLTYTIHNTGNATVAARQAASISGPFGRFRVPATTIDDTPDLLPGDRRKVSVRFRDVAPALLLDGTVTVTPLMTDESGSVASLTAVETTARGWAIPWVVLVGLGVLVLVGTHLLGGRRRLARLAAWRRPSSTSARSTKERPALDS
ncbi:hypothetical protein GCM10022234_27090 [Aeromicrobium panaciterrae]|uniref:COG1470 family protein n=1 Tax=Aeromicrobium panaciterrae TaxID=363861 RepID=UPI0031DF15FE